MRASNESSEFRFRLDEDERTGVWKYQLNEDVAELVEATTRRTAFLWFVEDDQERVLDRAWP